MPIMYLPSYVLVVSQEGDRAPFGWDKREFRLVMLGRLGMRPLLHRPTLSLLKVWIGVQERAAVGVYRLAGM